jgi:hypothetical protein
MSQDIHYKSYAFRRGQLRNATTNERRLAKAKMLLNKLKAPSANGQLTFFCDEKNFSWDQKINRKNNQWLCLDISELPIMITTKVLASVMVLGGFSNKGYVIPPISILRGLKINAKEYVKVLQYVLNPWMDEVAAGHHYIFQQDATPAQKAKVTQD